MKYEVKVPAVGESITEATIGSWMKKNGEAVKRNDVLLLLETDKASVEVVAEQDGVLFVQVEAGQTVPIGSVVAHIDNEAKTSVASASKAPPKPSDKLADKPTEPPKMPPPPTSTSGKTIAPELQAHMSPAVQRIVTEKGLNPAEMSGTGRDGRLTKADALVAQPSTSAKAPGISSPVPTPEIRGPSKQGSQKRVPMTTIRKRIAERLMISQQTTATLTTFNEVDMTNILAIRGRYKDQFKEKYAVSLGFMGFFVKASIEALKTWPAVNSFIDGHDLVYNNYYNVGVAVGTDKGLIVPVIKDADQLSIAGIELAIKNFANKAREGKISIDDLNGGTFTISNGGVYGSLMSTPILNPPQSAILGMHKMEERAVVINGKIEIRTMMYLAVSYDHRVIDGKEAVSFLVKIKEGLENPERMLLEI
jgi:2-oxoglutarate dehydrogenase E2 component (dihydrolipoamide succinyltransferase)